MKRKRRGFFGKLFGRPMSKPEVGETIKKFKPYNKISITLNSGKKISGKFRGRTGATAFVEQHGGQVTTVNLSNVKKIK